MGSKVPLSMPVPRSAELSSDRRPRGRSSELQVLTFKWMCMQSCTRIHRIILRTTARGRAHIWPRPRPQPRHLYAHSCWVLTPRAYSPACAPKTVPGVAQLPNATVVLAARPSASARSPPSRARSGKAESSGSPLAARTAGRETPAAPVALRWAGSLSLGFHGASTVSDRKHETPAPYGTKRYAAGRTPQGASACSVACGP